MVTGTLFKEFSIGYNTPFTIGEKDNEMPMLYPSMIDIISDMNTVCSVL